MAVKSIRRLTGNFSSLMASEVVNRATTFVLYALIARYLGTFEFGQLSLALTLFFVFQVLAGAGLKTLITREIARDKTKTSQYLVNGSAVVVVCSLLSMSVLLLFVRVMNYSPETASVIILLSLGILPFSLSVLNKAVFQAWERMHYIVWANVPVHFAKVGIGFLLLWRGYGLFELILLLLASYITILVFEWWLMLRNITRPRVSIDRGFSVAMIRSATTFLGITGIVAINTSLDLLLLSRLANETDVGLYNASFQLITPLIVVYDTIMMSVFPEMCKRFAIGLEGLKRLSGHVIEILMAIALPIVTGLLFLSGPVLLFIFGDTDFVMASQTLRILAWILVLTAFTHVLGRALVASLREKVPFHIVIITTFIKLLLGLYLISQFGLVGAAVSALITALIEALMHYASVSRLLFQIPLGRLAWKPLVASVCMAIYLTLVHNLGFLPVVVSAGGVYTFILLALLIWSNGGPRQSKAKYQYLWSK